MCKTIEKRPKRTQVTSTGTGFWLLCLGGLLVLPLGCGKDKPPPPPQPAPKAKVEQAVQPEKTESPVSEALEYFYTPVGKRDPFRSEFKLVRKKAEHAPGGILTKFEIDQLKLVAVITGIPSPRAQVELPDGKGVTVRVGTQIGKNYGRVVRIARDTVEIAEDFLEMGKKKTNKIYMKLRKDDEK